MEDPTERNEEIIFPERGVVRVVPCAMPVPDAGEVLIATRATLVSTGTELTALMAAYAADSTWQRMFPFPVRPGYDNVGEVVEVGAGVAQEWLGRRVATLRPHARFVVAAADACRPVPDEVRNEQAVFSTIAEIVMNGVRRSRLTWGEVAVVYGAGLLGQIAAQVCLHAGASAVVVADVAPERLRLLPDDSRLHAVDPRAADVAGVIRTVTHGRMADVVFEVTAEPGLLAEQIGVLREQGRIVVLSSPRGPVTIDLHDHCVVPSISIIGAHNMSHPRVATLAEPGVPQRHCELFFDLVRQGVLDVNRLLSERVAYRDAPGQYDRLQGDRSGTMGVVLDWQASATVARHPDEMLGIVDQVFRPMGRDAPAPGRAPDLAAARGALPTEVADAAWVGASGRGAANGDAWNGDAWNGGASEPDCLTVTFEIGGMPIALILAANIEQPFLGRGLLSLLHLRPQAAKTVSDRRPIDVARSLAGRLNHAEGSVREPLLGGGWVPHSHAKDPTGLAQASIHPNATMVRELPFLLAADAVRRARWAVGELDLAQRPAARCRRRVLP